MDIQPTLEPDFWAHCPDPDLSKPSLQGLAWMLEREAEWKQDFAWYFNWWYWQKNKVLPIGNQPPVEVLDQLEKCGTAGCAIGLAHHTWGGRTSQVNHNAVIIPLRAEIRQILQRRGQSVDSDHVESIWRALFTIANKSGPTNAEHVAGRIKDFLSNKPIR